MKKYYLIPFFLVILAASSFAEVVHIKTDQKNNAFEGYFYQNGKIIAYQYKDFIGMRIIDGQIPDGPVYYRTSLDKRSPTRAEMPYQHNKVNGLATSYYDNGNPAFETPYEDNRPNGLSVKYSYVEKGKVSAATPYRDGFAEGVKKVYGGDGAIVAEYPFKKGKLDGTGFEYFDDGNIKAKVVFSRDKVATYEVYDDSGRSTNEKYHFDQMQIDTNSGDFVENIRKDVN
jgi:antitoxin component YwqK of YwqJK toxin-antitoxin module